MSAIILKGDISSGFQAIGPFDDWETACAADDKKGGGGWVMTLQVPETPVGRTKDVKDKEYGPECIVFEQGGQEVRCPAFPLECDYVRVTKDGREVAYWSQDEWSELPDEVMGAIMGLIAQVARGEPVVRREAEVERK